MLRTWWEMEGDSYRAVICKSILETAGHYGCQGLSFSTMLCEDNRDVQHHSHTICDSPQILGCPLLGTECWVRSDPARQPAVLRPTRIYFIHSFLSKLSEMFHHLWGMDSLYWNALFNKALTYLQGECSANTEHASNNVVGKSRFHLQLELFGKGF